jgi:hypothetical protein
LRALFEFVVDEMLPPALYDLLISACRLSRSFKITTRSLSSGDRLMLRGAGCGSPFAC